MSFRAILLLIAMIAEAIAGVLPANHPLAGSRLLRPRATSRPLYQLESPGTAVPVPVQPLAASQASPDRVIDTLQVTECFGAFCRPVTYQWIERPSEPDCLLLFREGAQIGGWNLARRLYLDYSAATNTWSTVWKDCPPIAVPEPRPASAAPRGQALDDHARCNGVRRDLMGLAGDEERFTGPGGQKLHRRLAERMLGASNASPQLIDDSDLQVLVITGPDDARTAVLKDLDAHPALAEFKGKLLVCALKPTHWQLQPGFVTTGNPTIYLEAKGGKVLHRQDDYDDGPEAFATALRRARPDYDPKKDPDLRKAAPTPAPDPTPSPSPATPSSWNWLAALLAAVAAIILIRKRTMS